MSVIEISEELMTVAKNYLDITWTDEAADAKLEGQLRRGMSYIMAKTGVSESAFAGDDVDYRAQELLLNYVLYDRQGSADQFKKAYRSDIIGLHARWEVQNASSAGD